MTHHLLSPVLTALVLGASPALAQETTHPCDNVTPIYTIQGAGHVSPFVGQTVTTCGVVTAVGFNFWYLQDPTGDGDSATSDGLFVFQSSGVRPNVGDLVRVQDIVEEFIQSGAATGRLSVTQFAFPTVLDTLPGQPLPTPVVIGQSGRVPPAVDVISADELPVNLQNVPGQFDPANDGIDFYESLEGMLVTLESPVAVGAVRQFGTFSAELFAVANDGADVAPADALNARGGIKLQPDPNNEGDQNPERVQVQFDGTLFGSTAFPAINVGDQLDSVTGPLGYSFGNYEVISIGSFGIAPAGLTEEVSPLTGNGPLRVAAYNILNHAATSSDDAQRAELAAQIVNNLDAPDIIALQEVQDNNGSGTGVLAADQTLQALVDAIVAAGGPTYTFADVAPLVEVNPTTRDTDPDNFGGADNGNIRNSFLYNADRVDLVSFTGLTRGVLASRGVADNTAFDFSRDPLEAVFEFRGQTFVLLNNHFSSRFGSTPVFGGPQPFVQAAEAAREAQSQAMNDTTDWWLAQDPNTRVVVLGDLNTFEFTNDLAEILPGTGSDKVLTNLIDTVETDDKYSFNFEGNSQALDHVFVTDNARRGAKTDYVHVNVDFSRLFSDVTGSDHEPVLVALDSPGTCLYGTTSVNIADRADVNGGVASEGTVTVGVDAGVANILAEGVVRLRNRAKVTLDVVTAATIDKQQGATVEGNEYEGDDLTLPALDGGSDAVAGTGNLNVNSGNTTTLTPGSYGRVNVNSGGTLVLDGAGTYAFVSLRVNSQATLEAVDSAEVVVDNGFTFRGDQTGIGPINVTANGGRINLGRSFDGEIYAPMSDIVFGGNNAVYSGDRYVGSRITVRPGVGFTCD